MEKNSRLDTVKRFGGLCGIVIGASFLNCVVMDVYSLIRGKIIGRGRRVPRIKERDKAKKKKLG